MAKMTEAELTAFRLGREAFDYGSKLDENPFPQKTLRDSWQDGWMEGCGEDIERRLEAIERSDALILALGHDFPSRSVH